MRFVALALFAATTVFVSVGPAVVAAPVPKAAENPDLTAMQGKWTLTDIAFNGQSLGAEFAAKLEMTMEVRDNTTVTTGLQHKQRVTNMIALDATANPRRVTTTTTAETDLDGKPVANPAAKKKGVAIYKIERDTLVIAGVMGDEENAPKGFADKGVVSMTFTRVKK